ncbi:hypothetical protein COO60DRAFT_738401 [Scenedesmus sp. NREL 46B-D3]|nr:hypothetical protein COO60DRAFT_738401 [Scenedesmus sp. NREL 46B-D3]
MCMACLAMHMLCIVCNRAVNAVLDCSSNDRQQQLTGYLTPCLLSYLESCFCAGFLCSQPPLGQSLLCCCQVYPLLCQSIFEPAPARFSMQDSYRFLRIITRLKTNSFRTEQRT